MSIGVHQHICTGVSFCTRCMERLTVKVPMPLAEPSATHSGMGAGDVQLVFQKNCHFSESVVFLRRGNISGRCEK
ncbi:hypothetical protein, partial [Faecalibacterium duncaniae]|uniref:hypothetical protein n=1 Tax=Faecalibacterium duncaniae (strain DSM 17677 / JCM 31915 / A2-165) TaxID=411483 RepID=UPI002940A77F